MEILQEKLHQIPLLCSPQSLLKVMKTFRMNKDISTHVCGVYLSVGYMTNIEEGTGFAYWTVILSNNNKNTFYLEPAQFECSAKCDLRNEWLLFWKTQAVKELAAIQLQIIVSEGAKSTMRPCEASKRRGGKVWIRDFLYEKHLHWSWRCCCMGLGLSADITPPIQHTLLTQVCCFGNPGIWHHVQKHAPPFPKGSDPIQWSILKTNIQKCLFCCC